MLNYLDKSVHSWVTKEIIEQIVSTKDLITNLQWEGNKVAVLLVTGDVTNASHIQYINTAREAMLDILWDKSKLFVWVESDWTTEMRKHKRNIYSDIERRYIFHNLKGVDHAFISFSNNEKRPYWSTMFLYPDLLISHEEYFPDLEWFDDVSDRLETIWSQFHIVRYTDGVIDELSWMKFRDDLWRSTTNTIKQIFDLYIDNPKYNERLTR